MSTEQRKDEHLDICLQGEQAFTGGTGLDEFELEYDALPELDLESIDLSITLLGKRLQAPLLIGAMTGGSSRAEEINSRLARGASAVGIAMGLGSQRAMLEDEMLASSYLVRQHAPDLPLLIGNLGAAQVGRLFDHAAIRAALDTVEADALAVHLNPLQEVIQPEGDSRFAGVRDRLAELCSKLAYPVIVKEVGCGISARTAAKLAALPISGLETAGRGGTCWPLIEAQRDPDDRQRTLLAAALARQGVGTARSIIACRQAMGERLVIASGGIRTGRDIAVALALGADAVAIAHPLLVAAATSEAAVIQQLDRLLAELKLCCFATGAADVASLKQVRLLDKREPDKPPWCN